MLLESNLKIMKNACGKLLHYDFETFISDSTRSSETKAVVGSSRLARHAGAPLEPRRARGAAPGGRERPVPLQGPGRAGAGRRGRSARAGEAELSALLCHHFNEATYWVRNQRYKYF